MHNEKKIDLFSDEHVCPCACEWKSISRWNISRSFHSILIIPFHPFEAFTIKTNSFNWFNAILILYLLWHTHARTRPVRMHSHKNQSSGWTYSYFSFTCSLQRNFVHFGIKSCWKLRTVVKQMKRKMCICFGRMNCTLHFTLYNL